MSSGPVAVIDIGSNSIKLLVATRGADGTVTSLESRTLDARISAGISQRLPELGAEGMTRGLEAVQALLAAAAAFQPAQLIIVGTSAVRDARNGREFCERVRAATGHPVRILAGDEEANFIGRGLTCDPALERLRDFYVFDLGGGSLECLAFRDRQREQAASMQLGCVRLTESFVADPTQPLADADQRAIEALACEALRGSGFRFSLPRGATAVGTGGTVATVRAIIGARDGKSFEVTPSLVAVTQLSEMLAWLGALTLVERRQIPGLPPARADVFPAALVTLLALAKVGGLSGFQNSLYNLRYGLADEALTSDTGAPNFGK